MKALKSNPLESRRERIAHVLGRAGMYFPRMVERVEAQLLRDYGTPDALGQEFAPAVRAAARALMWEHTPNAKSKVSDKINMDGIAELFGLDTYEHLHERNIDYFGDAGYEARKYALSEGASEEEADEADMKAQEEADTEMFHQWHSAVMAAAESLFEKHGLTLVPAGKKGERYPYEYKVVPEESWEKALVPIIETVNGVGYFHFGSVKEFLRSGPYTPREGVLTHMHWIKDYPAVYGDTSAQRIYERSFR